MYVSVATWKSRNTSEIKRHQKYRRETVQHHKVEKQYKRKKYNEEYRRFPHCGLFSLRNRV